MEKTYPNFIRKLNYHIRLILWSILLFPFGACGQSDPTPVAPETPTITFSEPIDQGEVNNPTISEASGIVASRNNTEVLWTHNDSGDDPKIYAISTSGEVLGEWVVAGARNRDWEDIAIGPGPEEGINYLYVGDIGDNQAVHPSVDIYRFPEPTITDDTPVRDTIRDAEKINAKYLNGARDAETLLVDPFTKDIYIISKRDNFAWVFQLAYPQSTRFTIMAKKIGEWNREIVGIFNQPVGGDISPDGKELLIKSYVEILYWRRESEETTLLDLLQQDPKILPYVVEPQGEAVGWAADGSGYFTLSEKQGNPPPRLYFYERTEE